MPATAASSKILCRSRYYCYEKDEPLATARSQIYHNLSVMLAAGVPLTRALRTAAAGTAGPLPKALRKVADDVSAGQSLEVALANQPRVFAPLDSAIVAVGAESGRLPEAFRSLSQWYSFGARIRRMLLSNMIYPVLLLHAAVFIPTAPSLILGTISPGRYLLGAMATLAWVYVPAALIFAIYRLSPQTGPIRIALDSLLLQVPLLGQAIRDLALSRYCRGFHMLYEAGLPITRCADLAAGLTGNAAVTRMVAGAARSARSGNPVSAGLSPNLPRHFVQTWQTAEQTGTLDRALLQLANQTAEKSEFLLVELARWLPRIIYVAIVIFVAIRIVSFYSSVYSGLL
ncbi:MAG: type II secretion system F family protein [Phycisphaerae bacterium]